MPRGAPPRTPGVPPIVTLTHDLWQRLMRLQPGCKRDK
ncbi:unnamed protein product [[Actinomadura] parvosata subsp. kistnae]|nr:unnamed protein product [Actinomadura parvosata subsp. kistnae]